MKAKKWIAMLCAAALVFSLTACGSKTVEQEPTETQEASDQTRDYTGKTLTGQVTAVDGCSWGN